MIRIIAYIAAALVLLIAGIVPTWWVGNSKDSAALAAAVDRLDRVPESFGDWTSTPNSLNPEQLEIGEIDGHIAREYTNKKAGERISVMIVCGRPGPISVHTPDWCYGGSGFVQREQHDERVTAAGLPPAHVRVGLFQREDTGLTTTLRIHWTWNAKGYWETPQVPRAAFAPRPFLYKLYLVRAFGEGDDLASDEVEARFLKEFLPLLDDALFPADIQAVNSLSDVRPSSFARYQHHVEFIAGS